MYSDLDNEIEINRRRQPAGTKNEEGNAECDWFCVFYPVCFIPSYYFFISFFILQKILSSIDKIRLWVT